MIPARHALIASLFVAMHLFATVKPGLAADEAPSETVPATERRFPPLTVPEGFKATLFACDPLVENLSVIALGPSPGTLYVAHDYVKALGKEIVRRSEVRLLRDTDGDGYADRSTLFAGEFNSIQGLEYHDGAVYVMHAPLLTMLRDTDGDGKADQRRDLLSGLGLEPEDNPTRLHCANGVVAGHDGWLYLALGDHGCDVRRPEGDRLLFQAGGILRCRPDGTDLHVFADGMRNIYDVALDEQLNVFVRDNENDGGDFMIRVCHSFFGADHGYPYLYRERPEEGMQPLADLGRGSSAGGVCYLETAFPKAYRDSLLFCEWGRAVVRYPLRKSGSGFAQTKEFDLAAGAPNDPYGFKPTDLVVDRDGSLLISDWGDGQRPKRGRGRIYRITWGDAGNRPKPNGVNQIFFDLDSASYLARVETQQRIEKLDDKNIEQLKAMLHQGEMGTRARLHTIWILANKQRGGALADLFKVAESKTDSRVRAQAVRAIADLTDPVLMRHRLDAGRGSANVAGGLAKLDVADPRVLMEVVVALGRLRWRDAPQWLKQHANQMDSALAHAMQQTLRRCDNWAAVLELLDSDSAIRPIALRAVANQPNETIVDGLSVRLDNDKVAKRRGEYADALARVYKKPAPWVYWGFRPARRPANTVEWSRTQEIEKALNQALGDGSFEVRQSALAQMLREGVPVSFARLSAWAAKDDDAARVALILESLKARSKDEKERSILAEIARGESQAADNRITALSTLSAGLNPSNESVLFEIAQDIGDDVVQAWLLREFGKRARIDCNGFLLKKLTSRRAEVRAAAIDALARRNHKPAASRVAGLLDDDSLEVRRSAAEAAGRLQATATVDRLRQLAADGDAPLCRASLESLRQLKDQAAVSQAVDALAHPETQVTALRYLQEFGGPKQLSELAQTAQNSRSTNVLAAVVQALNNWSARQTASKTERTKLQETISRIHGNSGILFSWTTHGPFLPDQSAKALSESKHRGKRQVGTGPDAIVRLSNAPAKVDVHFAVASVAVEKETAVEFLAASNGRLRVSLNGKQIHHRKNPTDFRVNSDRFEATLVPGANTLLVEVSGTAARQFHLRFREKSSKMNVERLMQLALASRGNIQRGREVFLNADKSQCIKCHRIEKDGARIGPDLTGLGNRFSRIHIVESILEPSRTIAPSYQTIAVALTSGKVLSGVKIRETGKVLVLGDNQGKIHEIARDEIDQLRVNPQSTMPDDVAKRLTDREFVDLIAFLKSLTNR